VTEAAQEPEVNIEKGHFDFDLNQEVFCDKLDCPINLLTSISFVSASRPAAAPGLPVAPLQFEGSLGWKGCAATSVRRLDAANSSSGSWDATRTQSQDNNLYVVRPILPTSTEHTRYITISL
jgi:hypothetical protein